MLKLSRGVLPLAAAAVVLSACVTTPSAPSPGASSPAPAGSTAADPAANVKFLDDGTVARLRAMTIDLPAFPITALNCPAGRFTFKDGRVSFKQDWYYIVLHKGKKGIFANVDGQPGDEILLTLHCGPTEVSPGLLVVKQTEGTFTALGYVPGLAHFDRFYALDGDLVAEAHDSESTTQEQRWRFHWNGTAFAPVPANLPFAKGDYYPAEGDLRESSFSVFGGQKKDPCDTGGTLSFVDGRSGIWEYREEGITLAAASFQITSVAYGQLDEPAPLNLHRDAIAVLTCTTPEGKQEQWVYAINGPEAKRLLQLSGPATVRIEAGLAVVETDGKVRKFRSVGYMLTEVS